MRDTAVESPGISGPVTGTDPRLQFSRMRKTYGHTSAPVTLHSTEDARGLGIGTVFPELSLVPDSSVADHVAMATARHGSRLIRRRSKRNEFAKSITGEWVRTTCPNAS